MDEIIYATIRNDCGGGNNPISVQDILNNPEPIIEEDIIRAMGKALILIHDQNETILANQEIIRENQEIISEENEKILDNQGMDTPYRRIIK